MTVNRIFHPAVVPRRRTRWALAAAMMVLASSWSAATAAPSTEGKHVRRLLTPGPKSVPPPGSIMGDSVARAHSLPGPLHRPLPRPISALDVELMRVLDEERASLVRLRARFRSARDEREALARALAGLLSDLHRRGIYHADLKANNIVWVPGASPGLLDYGRVQFGWSVSPRRRIKNLAQLNSSLHDVVPGPLRERGLRRYIERSRFRGDVRKLREAVITQSLRRAHRWHGC